MEHPVQTTGNILSLGAFGGWLAGVLPVAATAVTFIWFRILIVEKVTGKQFHCCLIEGAPDGYALES